MGAVQPQNNQPEASVPTTFATTQLQTLEQMTVSNILSVLQSPAPVSLSRIASPGDGALLHMPGKAEACGRKVEKFVFSYPFCCRFYYLLCSAVAAIFCSIPFFLRKDSLCESNLLSSSLRRSATVDSGGDSASLSIPMSDLNNCVVTLELSGNFNFNFRPSRLCTK